MSYSEEITIGGRTLSIEIGKVANQANGAAWVRYGDTIVLAAVTSQRDPIESDFLPLTVDYREKMYASGKIPGGFFKREGRPSESETLVSRLIDRPIRPLFPKDYRCETQVLLNVYSADMECLPDMVAAIAASAALTVSDIPFDGPVALVRVGLIDGQFILNPSFDQIEKSEIELVVAGSYDAITMVEGGCKEISEERMIEAIEFAHTAIREIIEVQKRLAEKLNVAKREHLSIEYPEGLEKDVKNIADPEIGRICRITDKSERKTARKEVKEKILTELEEKYPECESFMKEIYSDLFTAEVRRMMLEEKKRLDGRGYDDIRPISIELGLLPRAHGSALFTRGQTQSLGVITLGTKQDEQRIDGLAEDFFRRFIFHYNFPPFSTGEVKKFLGTGRREVGHGNLAHRALQFIVPAWDTFPYTLRVVSEILESNGSSSMASVCSGSLAMMAAGVPTTQHVAGIAMGLVMDGDQTAILTDILGDEDHLGDMDFKVAGTRNGITAIQMDIKIKGLSPALMSEALGKAQNARFRILDIMEEAISEPRPELSDYAPRILSVQVPVDEIGTVIGPGGKMIREITEKSGAKVDIMDDGKVNIASVDAESGEMARKMVLRLIEAPEPGKNYTGTVRKVTDFGAFVEILPGKDGLLHISEIAKGRIDRVTDEIDVGDEIEVKLLSVDRQGKMDLSRRAVLMEQDGELPSDKPYTRNRPDRPSGRDNRGGGRDRRDRNRRDGGRFSGGGGRRD
ncbi:polyribonucleotide nucleotidyltransferase [candidate division LCP-89 bacterium B3_LCP]|uniref:Polyribonucleotide nucleotidyltransferase n=1 Tax=candidate division LCP-89 bacterium B3_LCP TaxID=2012998 RepID=A0A532V3I6_UNCL8|nr:MAG: polyribonucleotide nucleotidyltransferase [candidate division LCP-89 bacterium B3_LCP]